jgi:6-phosphogluconate dehydrogenase
MANQHSDLAVIGLGVMGANFARNFASRGLRVAVFDRSEQVTRTLVADHPDAGFVACSSLEELVAAVERPRRLVLLVPAGAPVDESLDALDPLLDVDDIVIDAGNSLFKDSDRRAARSRKAPWRFVGMGISGGSEGALVGPSIMPGGDPEAWERLRPVLESVAAVADSGPCVAYCGRGSAGHFVKMVHNGIEYGDMQLIAESAVLLRHGLGLTPTDVADVFSEWNAGELESYLVEITADIFRTADPRVPGGLLLDAVLDRAGQKGTGRWTVKAALDLGVAIPTIAAAVEARVLSANRERRLEAEAAFGPSGAVGLEGVEVDDVRAALYAAKVASYSQGFDLLARASEEYDYGIELSEVARIWQAGCIIRARFLDRVRDAFAANSAAPSLLALAPTFRAELIARVPSWRRVVAAAIRAGLPTPGLAASLAWFDTLGRAEGSANLSHAQRDYFGSHGYERVDAPGEPVHTDWAASARES